MEQFATLEQTPSYFKMINEVKTSGDLKKDSSCQPSFAYFRDSSKAQVRWGSARPMTEVCPTNYKQHEGTPTHSIWNNLTRRKSIVITN